MIVLSTAVDSAITSAALASSMLPPWQIIGMLPDSLNEATTL